MDFLENEKPPRGQVSIPSLLGHLPEKFLALWNIVQFTLTLISLAL